MDKSAEGKKNRRKGQNFELLVRKTLEANGWIVIKNSNDVINSKFTKAKQKFNNFTKRIMMLGSGFPDFIIWNENNIIIGVEVKSNGCLSKEEKDKCGFILKNKILHEIFIYSKKGIKNYSNYKK